MVIQVMPDFPQSRLPRQTALTSPSLCRLVLSRKLSGLVADARQRLLAIPSRLGAKLALPRQTVAAMDEEIRAALQALASGKGGGDA
jgi:hypothetical protein